MACVCINNSAECLVVHAYMAFALHVKGGWHPVCACNPQPCLGLRSCLSVVRVCVFADQQHYGSVCWLSLQQLEQVARFSHAEVEIGFCAFSSCTWVANRLPDCRVVALGSQRTQHCLYCTRVTTFCVPSSCVTVGTSLGSCSWAFQRCLAVGTVLLYLE